MGKILDAAETQRRICHFVYKHKPGDILTYKEFKEFCDKKYDRPEVRNTLDRCPALMKIDKGKYELIEHECRITENEGFHYTCINPPHERHITRGIIAGGGVPPRAMNQLVYTPTITEADLEKQRMKLMNTICLFCHKPRQDWELICHCPGIRFPVKESELMIRLIDEGFISEDDNHFTWNKNMGLPDPDGEWYKTEGIEEEPDG